jgi:hypothetical protein
MIVSVFAVHLKTCGLFQNQEIFFSIENRSAASRCEDFLMFQGLTPPPISDSIPIKPLR